MKKIPAKDTRRSFLSKSATGATAATILPRHIFGAPHVPPSEKYGTALIGCVEEDQAHILNYAKGWM